MTTLRFHTYLSIILFFTLTTAQNPTQYIPRPTPAVATGDLPTPTTHFFPTWPTTLHIPDATASVLLSSLSFLQSSWYAGSTHSSLRSAVYIAAGPSITSCKILPTPISTTAEEGEGNAQMSLAVNGYDWDKIVQAIWYTNVGEDWQKVVTEQEMVLQKAFDGVTGSNVSVSSGSSKGEKARCFDTVLGLGLVIFAVL